MLRARWIGVAVGLLFSGLAQAAAASGTYKQIYKFPSGQTFPANLIKGPNGSLFGVQVGSAPGVFELDPPAAGQTAWTYSLIYDFDIGTSDPKTPPGYLLPELLIDKAGNLYFGTYTGNYQPATQTVASITKLSPPAAGQTAWTQTILYDHHSPTGPNFGSFHLSYVDSSGVVYGFDDNGSGTGFGNGGASVFSLRPPQAGQTRGTISILTRYSALASDTPSYPLSILLGGDGSFYGLAYDGVASQPQTHANLVAFRLTPPASGQSAWTRTTIYTFDFSEAGELPGPLIADRSLNLYGVDQHGGTGSLGYAYKLAPPAAGQTAWQQSVLYNFPKTGGNAASNGSAPQGALIDVNGILVGTTGGGGNAYFNSGCVLYGCGTVFELYAVTPGGSAVPWIEAPLYKFGGGPYDGASPYGPLIPVTQADGTRTFFGFTQYGGHDSSGYNLSGNGTIYQFTPTPGGALGTAPAPPSH